MPKKPEEKVKITQIVSGAPNKVYGLGSDGLMYRWNHRVAVWELWKFVPPTTTQSKA